MVGVGTFHPTGTRNAGAVLFLAREVGREEEGREDVMESDKPKSLLPLSHWKEAGAWTWAEIELLGTDTDEVIAARLGRTLRAVKKKRQHRGDREEEARGEEVMARTL